MSSADYFALVAAMFLAASVSRQTALRICWLFIVLTLLAEWIA